MYAAQLVSIPIRGLHVRSV